MIKIQNNVINRKDNLKSKVYRHILRIQDNIDIFNMKQKRYNSPINDSELLSEFDICKFITQNNIINKGRCLKE